HTGRALAPQKVCKQQSRRHLGSTAQLGTSVAGLLQTALSDQTLLARTSWRTELPVLTGRSVTLREPNAHDVTALIDLLSLSDATRFGVDDAVTDGAVGTLVERAIGDRTAGRGFTYVVLHTASQTVVGLVQVRQLDPGFEAAEVECTLAPSSRGTGA